MEQLIDSRKRGRARRFPLTPTMIWLLFLTAFISACVTTSCTRFGKSSIPKHEMLAFDNVPVGQSRAYREYKTLVPGDKATISYLLWRMEYANQKFWRNGSTYTGREGAAWLRWKMRKFYPHVKTPDEFIKRVASRSERSLIPYRVSCAEYGCFHSLSGVLAAELKVLKEFEALEEKRLLEEEAKKRIEEAAKKQAEAADQEPLVELLTIEKKHAPPGSMAATNPDETPRPSPESTQESGAGDKEEVLEGTAPSTP